MLPISRPDVNRRIHGRLTWRDRRPTLVAAGLTTAAVLILIIAFGTVSPAERPDALASLTSSSYWPAAAANGACGTIAALMLTTLGLMKHLETRRMRLTVLGAQATTALAVGALLSTTSPLATGADVRPRRWQIDAVSSALLGLTTPMVGGFAVVLTSLRAVGADVFGNLPRSWVANLLADDEEAECEEVPEEAAERAVVEVVERPPVVNR